MRVLSLVIALFWGMAASAQSLNTRASDLIQEQLSGDGRIVQIEGFTGALSTRATIERLTIADGQGVWLVLEDAVLDWTASALLERRLQVEELSAARLQVLRLPEPDPNALPDPEASGFRIPELPVAIRIGTLSIPEIVLGAPVLGEAVTASLEASATLDGGALDATIKAARTDGTGGTADIVASYVPDGDVLTLKADIAEPAGGVVARALALPGLPSVRLEVDGAGPLDDFATDIALATDGQRRLGGSVRVAQSGDMGRAFSADIRGDIRPLLTEENRAFFGVDTALVAQGLAGVDGSFALDQLRLTTAQLRLDGSAQIGPGGAPEAFALTGRIEGQIPGTPVQTDAVRLALDFDAAQGPEWEFALNASDVRVPEARIAALALTGQGVLTPGGDIPFQGQITAQGQGIILADPALQQAVGDRLTAETQITVDGNGVITLSALDVALAHLSLVGDAEALPIDGRMAVTVNTALFVPDFSPVGPLIAPLKAGDLRARLTLAAELPGGAMEVSLEGASSGLDIDQPRLLPLLEPRTALSVAVRRDEEGTTLRRFSLRNDLIDLSGSGTLDGAGGQILLGGQLENVAVLVPELPEGAVTLDTTVSLRGDTVGVVARIADTIGTSLDGSVELTGQQLVFAASLDVARLSPFARIAAPVRSGTVALTVNGQAELESGSGEVNISGRSGGLDIGVPILAPLLTPDTQINAQVVRGSDGVITISEATLRNPELTADMSGALLKNRQVLTLSAVLRDLGRLVPTVPGRLALLAKLDGDTITATMDSATGAEAQVNGRIGLPGGAVDISARGAAPLALAGPFLGRRVLTGVAQFDLAMQGAPGLQALSGQITTQDMRFADPALGFVLSPARAQVQLAQAQARIDLSGALNDAPLTVVGGLGLTTPFVTDLTVSLRDMAYVYEDIARVRIGADLGLQGPAQRQLALSGDVRLAGAEIRVPDSGLGTADPVPPIRHVNPSAAVLQTLARADLLGGSDSSGGGGIRLPLDLNITATDPVFVRGRGLDAEFGGSVKLGGTVSNPVPVGRFDLRRGRLAFLGQRLNLTEGAITAAGSLIPRLRIVAEASAEDVTARIILEGPANAPELTLTSDPELPQDEVLSRLLFGRDVSSLSAFQVARLISSLATLASGKPGLLDNTRTLLGFDDLDIRTDATTGEAELAVGQYISDNIYSEVELGAGGDTQINLNLDLNDTTRLRGSANSQGGTGIGIFWERDY